MSIGFDVALTSSAELRKRSRAGRPIHFIMGKGGSSSPLLDVIQAADPHLFEHRPTERPIHLIMRLKVGSSSPLLDAKENRSNGDAASNNLDRTFRQRLHESAAIWLGHDPIVQNNDDAAVGFCSDEAPNALSKF
jgi:hypothetical protein